MEGHAWIAYGFWAMLLFTPVWSSEKSDEIPISHGQIWRLPYQITLSQNEVKVQTSLNILRWWSFTITSGHSRCPEVISTSDQKICEAPKAPYHSYVCTNDQSNTQIWLPLLESHDPIAYALKESFTASTMTRRKLSLFLMFSCLWQSRECICLSSIRSVSQHRGNSKKCLSCASTFFFGCVYARSVLVFIVVYFIFVGSLDCSFRETCLHQHGLANAPMATLEISLHVSKPMRCLA